MSASSKNSPRKERTYRNRWFVYIDILGFTKRILDEPIDEIIDLYQELEAILENDPKLKLHGLVYAWFSDTFIISTASDSNEELLAIDVIARRFGERLLLRRVPFTGAITYGLMYTNKSKNEFIGEALIDAYQYGDNANFVGLVLAPKAIDEIQRRELLPRFKNRYVPISFEPYKKTGCEKNDCKAVNRKKVERSNEILMHRSDVEVNGESQIKKLLEQMRAGIPKGKSNVLLKYDNALSVY